MFALVAACLAGSTTAGQARSALSATPENQVALGVSVSNPGQPPDLDGYVAAVGQKPAIVMWFQSFDEPLYYDNQMPAVDALGAIPMISWAPARATKEFLWPDLASGTEDIVPASSRGSRRNLEQAAVRSLRPGDESSSEPWGPASSGNTPEDYVSAWRHVVTIFRDAGATNVLWVWSPNVDCGGRCPFEAFYPGDAWVDWVALDGYNYGPINGNRWMTMAETFGSSYDEIANLRRSRS